MYSLQVASDANSGYYPSEQLEDDFITSLFSQNIPGNATSLPNYGIQNAVAQNTSSWFSAVQMDHGYAYAVNTEPSTLHSTIWEESSNTSTGPSQLNMSTYFSTFNPSAQFQTNDQLSVISNKIGKEQQAFNKTHRAHRNHIPVKSGNFKAIVKRKRKRTVFRTDQVEAMEEVFAKKPYVTKEDRQALVNKLAISDKSIKIWFQNRRLKIKRGEDPACSDEENRNSPDFERLDYVESKIHERTNEFGYVTLDDRIVNDLVNVINDYLNMPRNDNDKEDIKMEDINVEEPKKVLNGPLYEPISPTSTIDNSTEDISWEGQSPVGNEYLQRLIDIESIIAN